MHLTTTPTPKYGCPECGSHDTAITTELGLQLTTYLEPDGPDVTVTDRIVVAQRCLACDHAVGLPEASDLLTENNRSALEQMDLICSSRAGVEAYGAVFDRMAAALLLQVALIGEMVA